MLSLDVDPHARNSAAAISGDKVAAAAAALQQPQWKTDLLEDICACYAEQVKLLLEAGRQMDNALQRRSKIRTVVPTGPTGGNPLVAGAAGVGGGSAGPSGLQLSDYDKITLQIQLDIEAFGVELLRFFNGMSVAESRSTSEVDKLLKQFPSYLEMRDEVAEALAANAVAK